MKDLATDSRKPLQDAGEHERNGTTLEAMEKGTRPTEAGPGEVWETAPNPASKRSGQHVGECGVISRTDAELADVLELECWPVTAANPRSRRARP
jgi:hypothetical protein